MLSEYFVIEGEVNVGITITELGDGTLKFDVVVLDDTGSIGDLNALFFDLADDGLTDGLSVVGEDISGTAFKEDGVTKVSSYTNMNGEVIKDLGKFDAGIQFGSQGISEDDIRETSFVLSHDTIDLTLQSFSLQDFGVRLTSVGTEDGSREDSLKLGGTAPEFEEFTNDPVHVAVDNTMEVMEFDTFNPPLAGTDPLADFAMSVLENDTTDGMDYTGMVQSVNGSETDIGEIVLGSNGGAIRIYGDGTVDFSAASVEFGPSDFEYLNDGETAQTSFEYGIEGGSTAMLVVTVNGISGDPGGPGGPIDPPDIGGVG